MLIKEMKYCLDDIAIIPAVESNIESRSSCNPYLDNDNLPLFASPMPCVIDEAHEDVFKEAKINTIIPRGNGGKEELKHRIELSKNRWVAFSLREFEENFVNTKRDDTHLVLIDMANGHMNELCRLIEEAKKLNRYLVIMAGNVANPKTYEKLSRSGADYVRLSVGTGSACNTATFTGVYYPMASLIDECVKLRDKNREQYDNHMANIIADGGCNKIRDIIKCLALGADYVMLGGMLNSCSDSAGCIEWVEEKQEYMKLYYGMASKRGATELGKTADYPEGKIKYNKITGTLKEFSERFANYLRSTMSYCNAWTVYDFKKYTDCHILSPTAQMSFNQN